MRTVNSLSLFSGAVFFLSLLVAPNAHGQSAVGGGIKDNLDLPYDALGDSEEEEDAPEVVTFYGTQLEGDAFFYVIDRSGSMQDSGELGIAKKEVVKNISEFSNRVEFGVVFFDSGLRKFPSSGQPAESNPAMKGSAISWVSSMPGGSGSCHQAGLITGMQMLNRASARRRVLTYLGDGRGRCSGASEEAYQAATLAAVTALNVHRATVNTIGVMNGVAEEFLQRLAASNGGTYRRITR